MFQCLGLASEADGGCGEDWWHPQCIMGLPRKQDPGSAIIMKTKAGGQQDDQPTEDTEEPLPPGFPVEDDFETFICYKCLDTCPWIKRYAGTPGFLPPIMKKSTSGDPSTSTEKDLDTVDGGEGTTNDPSVGSEVDLLSSASVDANPRKRKSPDVTTGIPNDMPKRAKTNADSHCYPDTLPDVHHASFSLFLAEDFRDHFCRCPKCYLQLKQFPQLLEEEDCYEPPLSNSGAEGDGSVGTGSLLERGEAALSNMDRVKAIGTSLAMRDFEATCEMGANMIFLQRASWCTTT